MENGSLSTKGGEGLLSRMALNDNKAGMQGLDRDNINKIIMESSKGSKFYENELRREEQVNQRIEKMMLQKAQITEQQLKKAQAHVERMVSELEKRRNLSRVIVHVDMDAFYAAVETRDCPELKGKPMAVGSMSMLSTSNYHARKYGVRAAMPGFIAKKLCPDLIIVPCNFNKYKSVSNEIRQIFADYDPFFQPVSLDEAYMDFTEHLEQRKSWPEASRTHYYCSSSTATEEFEQTQESEVKGFSPVLFEDSPSSSEALSSSGAGNATGPATEVFGASVEEAVREMRFRIEQKTMLTASAGIAPNMMLAKVCSDMNKPNGQYRLPSAREAVMDFIQDLPVRKVSGIGKVSEKMLNALSISSCAHLGQQMALLSLLFSETAWHHFMQVSLGLGSTHIVRNGERKSMSTERTFKELNRPEEQFLLCRELCEDLAQDLKREDLKGKNVTLKLKNVNFEVKTRAVTLPCGVTTADEIFAAAKDLLKTEIDNESPQALRLRLMGVRISAFVTTDDKKHLQKSIIGFLQPGKADAGGDTQEIHHEHVEGDHPSSCPLTAQTCPTKKELPWPSQKKSLQEDQTCERPPQSFFQRAHAKRLQQNVDIVTPTHADAHKRPESSTKREEPKSNMSRLNIDVPLDAGASTSASAFDKLTCPVCFRQVSTDDLNVFNSHIDQCLTKGSIERHMSDSSDSTATSEVEMHKDTVKDNGHVESKTMISVDGGTVTSQRPRSSASEGPVLICPVCQLTQDTSDLTIFNRHVDVCLNQEVLHELGTSSASAEGTKSNVTADRSIFPPRHAGRGKTKRHDSLSSLPAKKAKGLNTIDRFFSAANREAVHRGSKEQRRGRHEDPGEGLECQRHECARQDRPSLRGCRQKQGGGGAAVAAQGSSGSKGQVWRGTDSFSGLVWQFGHPEIVSAGRG
ncbi:DNA polymerase kappa-like isoform X2 [Entelurus aequoreus]|uniref:DNA polymerase kappa-like isoform X2 n=1 Tax=Entelurus aequoreus TaxID=161455 RepID=UPI002B1CE45B|nr:DNA polymerase kappa-like isoform X2 [Entelurus aequoreus]